MTQYSLAQYWKMFTQDRTTFLMMVIGLAATIWAVVLPGWIEGLPILFVVLAVSVVISYLLTLSQLADLFALAYTSFIGLIFVWAAAATRIEVVGVGLRDKMYLVVDRVALWSQKAISGTDFSTDNLIFLLLLGYITWFLAFNAMWNLFRTRRLWHAVIPPGLALLINTYYYTGLIEMELFLVAYMIIAFMLAVHTNAVNREEIWTAEGAGYQPEVRKQLMRTGTLIVLVLVAAAWLAPTASASESLQSLWEQDTNPWQRAVDEVDRLFNGVEGAPATVPDYYGGETLSMGGPVALGEREVMWVYTQFGPRYYWRSKVFDTYTSNGQWRTNADVRVTAAFGEIRPESDQAYNLRVPIQQRFEVLIPATELLYAAPQPMSFASVPIEYEAILTGAGEDYTTPTQIRARNLIEQGETYSATSSISVASEIDLRTAGTEYPDWVAENYLSYPNTVTDRTINLANEVTSGAANPYDAAKAVETYLRENIAYNESVPFPPPNVEPVDYLLFERPEGYCNYYASAMAVMLRTQGIPSRIAAGFSEGQYVSEQGGFLVREANAHTWVEVFFPGYGWVEFEPTAAESPVYRNPGEIDAPNPEQPATEVPATPIPTEVPEDEQDETPGTDDPDDIAGGVGSGSFLQGVTNILLVGLRIIGVALLAGVALIGVGGVLWYRLEQWGMGEMSDISRSYARVNTYAGLAGLRSDKANTPYERAQQIGDEVPDAAAPVADIVDIYVKEQYSPARDDLQKSPKVRDDVRNAWREARWPLLKRWIERWLRRGT